jgi:hypothetical protein
MFFARLVDQNQSFETVAFLNEAIKHLRRKFSDLASRSEDVFKKLRLNFNDVLAALRKIFGKKAKDYENLGGDILKNRLRDYILRLQSSSSVLETTGLVFLEIVQKEAHLVLEHEPSHLVACEQPLEPPPKEKGFYGIADLLGGKALKLESGEIAEMQRRREVERKVANGRAADAKGEGYRLQGNEVVGRMREEGQETEGMTFEEIFQGSVVDQRRDQEFVELGKECERLRKRGAEVEQENMELPVFNEPVLKNKHMIARTIKERIEMISFMNMMTGKIAEHEAEKGTVTDPLFDREILSEIKFMQVYYKSFNVELEKMFGHSDLYERHTLDEYMYTDNDRFESPEKSRMDVAMNSPSKSKGKQSNKKVEQKEEEEEESVPVVDPVEAKRAERRQRIEEGKRDSRNNSKNAKEQGRSIHSSMLKQRRRQNEKRDQSKEYEAAYNSQREFEDHEREVYNEGQDQGSENFGEYRDRLLNDTKDNKSQGKSSKSKPSKKEIPAAKNPDLDSDRENEEYKQRLMNKQYKSRTQSIERSGKEELVEKIKLGVSQDEEEDSYKFSEEEEREAIKIENHVESDRHEKGKGKLKSSLKMKKGKTRVSQQYDDSEPEEVEEDRRDLIEQLRKPVDQESIGGKRRIKIKETEDRRKGSVDLSKSRGRTKSRGKEIIAPAFLKGLDSSKYENLIYKCKKRNMVMAKQDWRSREKSSINLRQGDIVCSVHQLDGWSLVYFEDNPKRYGFFPTDYLHNIS